RGGDAAQVGLCGTADDAEARARGRGIEPAERGRAGASDNGKAGAGGCSDERRDRARQPLGRVDVLAGVVVLARVLRGIGPRTSCTGAGDDAVLVGTDVDTQALRSRDAADVGGGRVGGGACVDGRAERGQVEVPTRRVNYLGVDDRDTGAGGRARPVADVVRQDRAGAADVEVGRFVVEADVVADRGVVRGPDAAAGVGHRVVDDDPPRRLVLRVRLDAVVLALVDDVVGDDAVDRGLGRVDAVYQLLVAGLPQPDVVDEVAVDQDVFERALVPEVDSGAALPAGPFGEELADGVDVATDDLDIGGVDHDAVAQARVDVAGDLEVLEPDVGVVDLDSALLGGAGVALDRGAPLVLGLDGDEVPGRAALGRDDVALVDAVSHQHGVAGAGGAHTARDRGLRRLRHQPRVRVVPGRRDVDRLRPGRRADDDRGRGVLVVLPGGGPGAGVTVGVEHLARAAQHALGVVVDGAHRVAHRTGDGRRGGVRVLGLPAAQQQTTISTVHRRSHPRRRR